MPRLALVATTSAISVSSHRAMPASPPTRTTRCDKCKLCVNEPQLPDAEQYSCVPSLTVTCCCPQAMAIGGTLIDLSPTENSIVAGTSWVNDLADDHRFHFQNGVELKRGIPFDWSFFEYLAATLSSSGPRLDGRRRLQGRSQAEVHVVCKGGTYDFGQICFNCPSDHDSPVRATNHISASYHPCATSRFCLMHRHTFQGGRNFLVVFNTAETVTIQVKDQMKPFMTSDQMNCSGMGVCRHGVCSTTRCQVAKLCILPHHIQGTHDGRQWFGSILAPFAEVVVLESAGFIDGQVIAKSYREAGSANSLQLHGNIFAPIGINVLHCGNNECGPLSPGGLALSIPGGYPGANCLNTVSDAKCIKKSSKGKCGKRKVRDRCRASCGACAATG